MKRAERHQLGRGLVHEDTAAMDWWANWIRRDEQYAQIFRLRIERSETVAKVAAQRSAEGFGVVDCGKRAGSGASAERSRQLQERFPQAPQIRALRRVAEEDAEYCASKREEKVRPQAGPFVNVLPAEENEILCKNQVDLRLRELLSNRPSVFVIHDAPRLIQHFPAALPRKITEIGVFQVEGPQELVEAAELEELAAIESAGSAAAIETRVRDLL